MWNYSWENKRIIELGSGTGVVGIVAANASKLNGVDIAFEKLVITDLPQMIPLIEDNLVLNGFQEDLEGKILAVELCWGQELPDKIQKDIPFDLILISDCVYLEACFDPLLQTLRQLMTESTLCLMSYKKRRRAEKIFFIKLRKEFSFREVTDHPHYDQYKRGRLYLFEITKK